MTKPKRVLSGMRPTGRLHLGHFFGALSNWLKLQQEYDCYFFVADWHALTTHYEDTSSIAENTLQVTMDWLAVGLDPQKSTLFVQSQVLEHAELHDHSSKLARARPHLQRANRKSERPRPGHLRLPGLPAPSIG
jgi:tryptophanyl-tRNA synthetase